MTARFPLALSLAVRFLLEASLKQSRSPLAKVRSLVLAAEPKLERLALRKPTLAAKMSFLRLFRPNDNTVLESLR